MRSRILNNDEVAPVAVPVVTTAVPMEAASIITPSSNDNHVYFYDEIHSSSVLGMTKSLRSIENTFQHERITRSLPDNYPSPPIWLHIQSGGGDVFASLSAADQIEAMQTPVYSIIEGMACSGATILSMSCKRRFILPHSYIMIHQLSSGTWGTYEQFKDELKLQDMVMESMINFYVKHSSMKRKEVKSMLKHDTWMSAQDALDKGFVDEIIGASK